LTDISSQINSRTKGTDLVFEAWTSREQPSAGSTTFKVMEAAEEQVKRSTEFSTKFERDTVSWTFFDFVSPRSHFSMVVVRWSFGNKETTGERGKRRFRRLTAKFFVVHSLRTIAHAQLFVQHTSLRRFRAPGLAVVVGFVVASRKIRLSMDNSSYVSSLSNPLSNGAKRYSTVDLETSHVA